MSKSLKGDVLSFCMTLPHGDGQAVAACFERTGDVPAYFKSDFNQFLRARYQPNAA